MNRALITAAVLTIAGACAACGGPSVHPAATTSAAAAARVSASARADCSKLAASPLPLATYDQLLTAAAARAAGDGTPTAAQVQAAKAKLAAEVRGSCPKFTYLSRQEH